MEAFSSVAATSLQGVQAGRDIHLHHEEHHHYTSEKPTEENQPIAETTSSFISSNSPESRGIFGRTQEIEKLVKRLQEKPIICLYGISGIGKTKLISEIARHTDFAHCEPMLLLPMSKTTNIEELYRYLAPSLGCRDENPALARNVLKQVDFAKLADYVKTAEPRLLHLYKAHELFNESGFYDHEIRNLLIAIAKYLPQLRIILESGEFPPEDLLPNSIYQTKKITGLDAGSLKDYFHKPSKHSKGWELSDEEAELLYQRLGGKTKSVAAHPLGMGLLASVAEGLNTTPMAIVERHNGQFYKELESSLFNDLYKRVLNPAEQCVLRLCALYRDIIPHHHIELLNQHAGDDNAFDHLVRRFLLNPDERQERYSLHSLFADLLHERSKHQDLRPDHALIGEAWLSQVKGKKRNSLPNILAANEAAYHLLQAQEFQQLRELSSNLLGHDTIPQLEQWSRRLHEMEDHENDRHVLELLVTLAPENPKAHRFLGEAIEKLEGRGNKRALEHYLTAYQLAPDFPPNLADVGRCYLARNEARIFVELVNALATKLRENVVNSKVQSIYTKCLDQLGDKDQAFLLRQDEIKAGSRNPAFYAEQAKSLAEQGKFTDALNIFTQAKAVGCMNDYLYAIQADILQQSGEDEKASILRQQQIQAGATNPAFYNDEATYWRDKGKYEKAFAVIAQAAINGCLNNHLISLKASIFQAAGNSMEASKLRQLQIKNNVRFAGFYNEEAIYLRDLGRYEDALELLDIVDSLRFADEVTRSIRQGIHNRQKQRL